MKASAAAQCSDGLVCAPTWLQGVHLAGDVVGSVKDTGSRLVDRSIRLAGTSGWHDPCSWPPYCIIRVDLRCMLCVGAYRQGDC
jgi:hypothetical protein